MPQLQQATPHVKKNLLLIRAIQAVVLTAFAVFYLQTKPHAPLPLFIYLGILAASFLPFFRLSEEKMQQVHLQYIVFAMDLVLLLGGLLLMNRLEAQLIQMIFLTMFISALSQSVGRSILVALAVNGLYLYNLYFQDPLFRYDDPFLVLSCALLFVVALHSGYLAYRAVQEESEFLQLARKISVLNEQVKEGNQAAFEYAAVLKNVLDSLPLGAIAVSRDGTILFVNNPAGKILDLNPKVLVGTSLEGNQRLLQIGGKMAQSLKDKVELKREYLDMDWKGSPKRFRLDSSIGTNNAGSPWGTLFLLQEALKPPTA